MPFAAEFYGGPWDGTRRTIPTPSRWAWLSGDDGDPRVSEQAADGSVPYILEGRREDDKTTVLRYSHAGYHYRVCTCGVIHATRTANGTPVSTCSLCGEMLSS